jgi:hypothetical protein
MRAVRLVGEFYHYICSEQDRALAEQMHDVTVWRIAQEFEKFSRNWQRPNRHTAAALKTRETMKT